ncbi:MAG: FtsX-like permease family protein [Chitinophagales bacterium]|nr:FtsX-like permease family protein [Chitinophagales bacterium]
MSRFPLFIAKRYLFSKKSTKAINIISLITALAMAIGVAALIIVMSTFNGFEDLVKSLYKVFYTDLVIETTEGKFFAPEEAIKALKNTDGVLAYTQVLKENALVEYEGKQTIVEMRGVDSDFYHVVDELDDYLYSGGTELYYNETPAAVVGTGVAYKLGINVMMPNTVLNFHIPRNDKSNFSDIANAFRTQQIYAGGVFSVQQDFDNQYVLVPIDFARDLLNNYSQVSEIEIKLSQNANTERVKKDLQGKLGHNLIVKTRFEQNATLYKVMKTEKWAVFSILSFIVLIAAFNIVGSLSMLVIEKKDDIAVMRAMGAERNTIRNIFLSEGILIAGLGSLLGLILGTGICLLQMKLGWVQIPGDTFIVKAYPVKLKWEDFTMIITVVLCISSLMAWLPAHRSVKKLRTMIPGKF